MVMRRRKEEEIDVRPAERERLLPTIRPSDLWTEMDRLFDEFRASFDDLLWPFRHPSEDLATYGYTRTPLADVADLGDRYEMRIELPGVPKDDINIEVSPTSLEISVDHKEDREDKGKHWLRRERSSMSFYRSLELPEEIKADDVEAELKDGVLTVMLPKVKPTPEKKTKKVKIK